jgi:hypothetical protein
MCALAGLSQKELAALVDRDTAQVARWVTSDERPQFDVLFAVPVLRQPLIHALAELVDDVVIDTVIHLRKGGHR